MPEAVGKRRTGFGSDFRTLVEFIGLPKPAMTERVSGAVSFDSRH